MFQFLNLDNASKAEKEILDNILFKGGAEVKRKEFFTELTPVYVGSDKNFEVTEINFQENTETEPEVENNEFTSNTTELIVDHEAISIHNEIPQMTITTQAGHQQLRNYYAPVPQNPHAGGQGHQIGHHPQISMYHSQVIQTPSGHFLQQFPIVQMPYGPPPPHGLGLPPHMQQQPYINTDVTDVSMHQKLHHDVHHPSAVVQGAPRFRSTKNTRGRRNEEINTYPPAQYYSNMNFSPVYYTTQAVTNMTGTPLIMPGSSAPNPIYHQAHYPPMYSPTHGAEHQHLQHIRNSSPCENTEPTKLLKTCSSKINGDPPDISSNMEQEQEQSLDDYISSDNTNNLPSEMVESDYTTTEEPLMKESHGEDNSPVINTPEEPEQPIIERPTLKESSSDNIKTITTSWSTAVPLNGNQLNAQSDNVLSDQQPEPVKDKLPADERPENREPVTKSWSSTVNGGTTVPPPPRHSSPKMTMVSKKDNKDASDFPQLSAPVVTLNSGQPGSSAGQSWASIASRKTLNGITTPVSNEQSSSQKGATNENIITDAYNYSADRNNVNHIERSLTNEIANNDETTFEKDPIALRLGDYLANYVLDHHTFSLTPRGLSNQSNFCYINATLQALVACPPFVNLFRSLHDVIGKKPCRATPIIQSVYNFIMEFEPITRLSQARNRKTSESFYVGANFEASGIRKVLGLLDGATFKVEGRQEDAEEFLSHILNGLHDEMIKVIKWSEARKLSLTKPSQATKSPVPPPPTVNSVEDDDDNEQWQVMGPRNKGCMTRKTSLSKSPISEMFVGQMCSALNRANNLKSTTLQPFFTLQLDIQSENVHSIRDALEGLSIKEEVSGCVSSSGLETEAWKQMSLEVLPTILILHMKRFVFDTSVNTIRKLDKRVDFSIDLEIAKDLLSINSKSKYTPKQRMYKLFAVVYHDGEEAIKGHYIADTFHPSGGSLWGQFGWIRYDDTAVKGVGENQILNPQSPRVPYLLYYRRVDTLSQSKKERS